MARFLYRVGTLSARGAWWVIALWMALLVGLGGAMLAVGPPKVADMSIPGTEFQHVIDDLKVAMPESAGASATDVLSTVDGKPFTGSSPIRWGVCPGPPGTPCLGALRRSGGE